MVFFGRYIEVTPHSRLVWTNDESDERRRYHVTFEEKGGKTLLVMRDSIPRRKLSTLPSPGWRVGCPRRLRNWTSFSSPWAQSEDGHEAVDLAAGFAFRAAAKFRYP